MRAREKWIVIWNGNAMNRENWNKLWVCTFRWWWQLKSKQNKTSQNKAKIKWKMLRRQRQRQHQNVGTTVQSERENLSNPSLVWNFMYCIRTYHLIWINIMDTSFEHAVCVRVVSFSWTIAIISLTLYSGGHPILLQWAQFESSVIFETKHQKSSRMENNHSAKIAKKRKSCTKNDRKWYGMVWCAIHRDITTR